MKTPAPSYGATFGRFTPSLRTYLGASYIHLRPVCRLRSPALAVADVTFSKLAGQLRYAGGGVIAGTTYPAHPGSADDVIPASLRSSTEDNL